jgi:hypothetical protein
MRTLLPLALFATLAACSGGDGADSSGLSSSSQIGSLSTEERTTLCEWSVDIQGGEGNVTECPDNVTVTVSTVADCVADSSAYDECDLTVGDVEECSRANADDPCGALGSPACAPLVECLFGNGQ